MQSLHYNDDTQTGEIFTVSELNRTARELLEDNFSLIWIEGEISNLACPSSGHIYFSLKDARAQVRCAMFRGRNQRLDFKPQDGQQLLARGRVSLYEGRGEFQIIIEYMEEAGDGKLRREFELLKQRLDKEGLFAESHKKTIPELPQSIGVVTSATGAAIRDIVSVLKRRFPSIPIVIYPTQVQGEMAAGQIVQAIHTANKRAECDVLIVARGGGSLEDLWPFNEEPVARAIYASHIPIVSGVGHEVDFTIADFVADRRVATPSAAAEIVSPNRQDWRTRISHLQQRISEQITKLIAHKRQQAVILNPLFFNHAN